MVARTPPPAYRRRLLDPLLDSFATQLPALMLDGARAAGKTTTLARRAATVIPARRRRAGGSVPGRSGRRAARARRAGAAGRVAGSARGAGSGASSGRGGPVAEPIPALRIRARRIRPRCLARDRTDREGVDVPDDDPRAGREHRCAHLLRQAGRRRRAGGPSRPSGPARLRRARATRRFPGGGAEPVRRRASHVDGQLPGTPACPRRPGRDRLDDTLARPGTAAPLFRGLRAEHGRRGGAQDDLRPRRRQPGDGAGL